MHPLRMTLIACSTPRHPAHCFSSISELELKYRDEWELADPHRDRPTPFHGFLALLAASPASSVCPLPLLASLVVHGVQYVEMSQPEFSFAPLLRLSSSLTSLELTCCFHLTGSFDVLLLELPALRWLDLSQCEIWFRGEYGEARDRAERERVMHLAAERGIDLLPWDG